MKKSVIAVLMVGALLLNVGVLFAQGDTMGGLPDEQQIKALRQDMTSQKKMLVAANMQLTETEAQKFWPVYDEYALEEISIIDNRVSMIKEYAEDYNNLTDTQAQNLIKRWIQADDAEVKLRLKYIPIFSKVLPAKKMALFIQIDRRFGQVLDVKVMSAIPLLQL